LKKNFVGSDICFLVSNNCANLNTQPTEFLKHSYRQLWYFWKYIRYQFWGNHDKTFGLVLPTV
jgi:hypothetical protein